MKRMMMALWLPMALSLAVAAGAAPVQQSGQDQSYGQASGQSGQDQQGQQGQAATGKQKVSMTGCLQAGTEPNTFILTNATTSTSKKNKGTQAPSEMARAESSYILVPSDGVDLSKHVGHEVRVSGNLEEPSGAMGGQPGATSSMPRIEVKSIKHVANTCR